MQPKVLLIGQSHRLRRATACTCGTAADVAQAAGLSHPLLASSLIDVLKTLPRWGEQPAGSAAQPITGCSCAGVGWPQRRLARRPFWLDFWLPLTLLVVLRLPLALRAPALTARSARRTAASSSLADGGADNAASPDSSVRDSLVALRARQQALRVALTHEAEIDAAAVEVDAHHLHAHARADRVAHAGALASRLWRTSSKR